MPHSRSRAPSTVGYGGRTDPMTDHDELSPPAEAPRSLDDQRPIDPHSVRAAYETLKEAITERPADGAPEARTSSAAPVAAEPASVTLPPDSPEARINAAY